MLLGLELVALGVDEELLLLESLALELDLLEFSCELESGLLAAICLLVRRRLRLTLSNGL